MLCHHKKLRDANLCQWGLQQFCEHPHQMCPYSPLGSLFSLEANYIPIYDGWRKPDLKKGGVTNTMNIKINGIEVAVEEGMEIRITSEDVSILRPSLLVSLKQQPASVPAKQSPFKAVAAKVSKTVKSVDSFPGFTKVD